MAEHGKLNVLRYRNFIGVHVKPEKLRKGRGTSGLGSSVDVAIFWSYIRPSPAGTALQRVSFSFLKMKRGRKVPKYSCHTSLGTPQHSKWSSLLNLARPIFYQGQLWFLPMPFSWFYEPLRSQRCREVPHLQVFLHNQKFNPLKQIERIIPN